MAAFVASATFVVPHLSNADVPSCKGRELREQILRPHLFTLGDTVPYLYLALTCYLLCSCMIYLLLASFCAIVQGGVSGHAGGNSGLHIPLCIIIIYTCCALVLYSAVHHIGLNTLHKRIIFIVLSHLKLKKHKICSYTYSPPL